MVEYRFSRAEKREFREKLMGGCEPCVINMLGTMTVLNALAKVPEDDLETQSKLEELNQLFGEGHISYRDLAKAASKLVPEKVGTKLLEMLQWAEALELPTEMGLHGIDLESEEHEHPEWELL